MITQGKVFQEMERHVNPITGVFVMIVASIFIGYYLTMTVIIRDSVTDNLNRLYQALLMGFWMGLIELLMVKFLMNIWQPNYNILLGLLVIGIVLFTWLIYTQTGIDEKHFMLEMINHHNIAIDMTTLAQSKITDPELKQITNNIIQSQKQEISQMKSILDRK